MALGVEADRRYWRSGVGICYLHGITIVETWDMAGSLKSIRSKVSLFSISTQRWHLGHFLGTGKLYYESTGTDIGVEIRSKSYRFCYLAYKSGISNMQISLVWSPRNSAQSHDLQSKLLSPPDLLARLPILIL